VSTDERETVGAWPLRKLNPGDHAMRRWRRIMARTPSDPRCKVCHVPFGGLGGRALRMAGHGPSRKNPNLCNTCFERAPLGGFDVEIGVLFADVRNFTSLTEQTDADELVVLLNRFYHVAARVLLAHDAIIDKLVGDEVMALFWPPLMGEETSFEEMVVAGEELLRGVGYGDAGEPWLSVGVGIAYGPALMGNVGTGDVKDFTAVGDVVNTAARLQAQAGAGQIVVADRLYEAVSERYPDAAEVELALKGKSVPVRAHVIDLAARRVALERG
jgi:adenylate cyclase